MTGRISGILLLFLVVTLPAQRPIPAPAFAATPQIAPRSLSCLYSNKVKRAGTVDGLIAVLDEAFTALYSLDDDAVPDLYGRAKGYLALTKPAIAKLKRKPEAKALFSACSLATLAASLQMVQARYDRDLRLLQSRRSDVQQQIREARQRICELEKARMSGGVDQKFSAMKSPQIQVDSDSRGTVISVSDILFKTDSAGVTPELAASLTRFARILLASGNYRVIIEGHTDNRGPEDYNRKLSERRAHNVLAFLVGQGVARNRMSAVGFGMSHPVAGNDTVDGRKKNRRVDLVVQEGEDGGEEAGPADNGK